MTRPVVYVIPPVAVPVIGLFKHKSAPRSRQAGKSHQKVANIVGRDRAEQTCVYCPAAL